MYETKDHIFFLRLIYQIYLDLKIVFKPQIPFTIERKVDLILGEVESTWNIYKYKSKTKFIYLFNTKNRKREGQIAKAVEKNLINSNLIENYRVRGT